MCQRVVNPQRQALVCQPQVCYNDGHRIISREVARLGRALSIQIEVPEGASEESLHRAAARGKETVVLTLQQEGELTIREAAQELGLTYEGYLRLLDDRGLPACGDATTPRIMDLLRQALVKRKTDQP